MRMDRRLVRLFSAALLLLLAVSVRSQTSTAADTQPAVGEVSVAPGINKDFLKTNVDVSKFVERFEKEGREIYEQREQIIQAVNLKSGSSVADIGAGTGLFTIPFARAVAPRGLVYAVEIVNDFVNHIRERAREAGLTNVQGVLCTERSVELAPGSVDLAFLCDVYHHFEYPHSSLASIHSALRPGGELVVVDFKREPGVSSEWTLNHVRAGQAAVTQEIEAAGFQKVEEKDFLKQNYFLRFRKTDAAKR